MLYSLVRLGYMLMLPMTTSAHVVSRKRGLRTSRSRRNLMIVVLVMLGSSTAFSATYVDFLILQMPTLGADPPDVTKRLLNYMIAWSWLERLNVGFLSLTQWPDD